MYLNLWGKCLEAFLARFLHVLFLIFLISVLREVYPDHPSKSLLHPHITLFRLFFIVLTTNWFLFIYLIIAIFPTTKKAPRKWEACLFWALAYSKFSKHICWMKEDCQGLVSYVQPYSRQREKSFQPLTIKKVVSI